MHARPGTRLFLATLLLLVAADAAAQPAAAATTRDRELLAETNAARTDPAGYARHLEEMLPLFDGNVLRRPGSSVGLRTNEGPAAVREAIRFLRAQAPLAPLEWSDGLWAAARDHVRDQGPSGSTGHTGQDGSSMSQRIGRYGRWQVTAAENIDYGSTSARESVISLIVDDGVPNRGHRTNVFEPRLRVMGATCGPHARYRTMCVFNYAGGFTASDAAPASPPSKR
ncbi:MAG: hypothetical protein KF689_00700 [Gemmatimonadaceae bacterium]|nr:hypothetical protein [Gemmatimonadaceae bacterium]MCW5826447.1 hypothetical protein [Gemmatimonadaceae bacterium]